MIRSMTGFGQARRQIGKDLYSAEIRSVNGRYFKAGIRLPELLAGMESDIDQHLRARLGRGSVQFAMRMKAESADAAHEINAAALGRYIEQLDALRPETDIKLTIDLSGLLALPGVCNPPEGQDLLERFGGELLKLVDEAIDATLVMRTREGLALAQDLLLNCKVIEDRLAQVAGRAPQVVQEYHQRLRQRVAELTASAEIKIDALDLAREVALFAERCDVNEEISRLGGHIEQFRAAVGGDEQPGRKLDFLAQEMLREANTIASKAASGEIIRHVVEIKTAIDRIKEQVQNVE
jgi:uncharacterized protein (TIGR00255 family)